MRALLLVLGLAACAPMIDAPGPTISEARLADDGFYATDGVRLGLRQWRPTKPPKAVILALHGFNDYSNFFDAPGRFLADAGILSYAYDQRGFGESPNPGTWAGVDGYVADAVAMVEALKRRHPKTPFYLLGDSMGGAVAMVTLTHHNAPEVDGVILAGPAVWGRATMPWYQRAALWLGAHTLPSMTLTGRGLNIKPSDNYEMLVALGRDPLILKETRIGTVFGLVNLMDQAFDSASKLRRRALVLYGEKDEIIPHRPTRLMLKSLPDGQRVAIYENGYHMLLRDLDAKTAWTDIAAWIDNPNAALPSGADKRDIGVLAAD